MAFGALPQSSTTISGTAIPASHAYVPGTANGDFTAVEGIAQNTDGNGNKSTAVRLGLKDGDDVTQGVTTDSAVTGDNNGTISAKLRGLNKIFADIWDSTNHWLKVNLQAGTSGGSTPSHTMSAASNNATSLKASAGQVYGLSISNNNASARYFKLYDKNSSPTVGTDVPKTTIQVPGNGTVIRVYPVGLVFSSGIAYAATGGIADTDNTSIGANDLSMDVDYK